MKKVTAGIVGDIANTLKKISNSVLNAFDHLVNLGLNVDDVKEQSDGTFILQVKTSSGNIMKVKMTPKGNDKFDMQCKKRGGKTIQRRDVKSDDVDDAILDAVKEIFGESEKVESEKISSSAKFIVKKSIKASKDIGIDIMSVFETSDPVKAYSNIGMVFSNGEFLDSIPEGETTYGICDDGECLDVCPSEGTPNTYGCIRHLIQLAYTIRLIMQYLSWTCGNVSDQNIRSAVDSMRWMIDDQIQQLGELSVELHGHVDNPKSILCFGFDSNATDGGNCIDINAYISSLDSYICALELYSCGFSSDIQNQMLQWTRTLKKEVHYHLKDYSCNMISCLSSLFDTSTGGI